MNVSNSRPPRTRHLPWWRRSALALFAFGLMGIGAQAQVLFSDTFTGGVSNSGFTNVQTAGTATSWSFTNPCGRVITGASFDSGFAIFDSDNCNVNPGETAAANLVSVPFDASTGGTYELKFDYQYRTCCGSLAGVDVWNGSTWTNVFALSSTSIGYPNPAVSNTINITAATGASPAAQVRFTYTGFWDYWWALDNVSVTRLLCTAPSITQSIVPACPGGFGVNLDFTALGSGAPYSVTYSVNGTPQTPIAVNTTGIVSLTGFAEGADVDIVVVHASDNVCNVSYSNVTFTCPPPNDNCANAVLNTLAPSSSVSRSGNTNGATNSEAFGFSVTGVVWESFTLTDCVQSLTVEMCGTTPVHALWWGILYTDCALTASPAAGNGVFSCVDGNLVVTYGQLPAGTYYWPIIVHPSVPAGPYQVNFVSGALCPPPPSSGCSDPGSFTSNTPIPILDNQTFSGTLATGTLTPGTAITDMDVYVSVTHTWNGDITLTLTSPLGTPVILRQQQCGSFDGMDVRFDDEAGVPEACPPNNVYQVPFSALSAFDGEFLEGTWTLTASDGAGGDFGQVNSWCLIPTTVVLTCTPPSITRTVVPACPGGFNVDLDFTALGNGAPYTVNYNVNGVPQTPILVVTTGVVTLTGFANGDDVDVTVEHGNDPQCNVNFLNNTYYCPPPNDECSNVVLNSLDPGTSVTRTGTTFGSTNNPVETTIGQGLTTGMVWESFTLTECVQTLVVQMCGTAPVHQFYWGPIYTDCNGTESAEAAVSSGFTCVDGNLEINFTSLAAGTYYWPLFIAPGFVDAGPYSVTFVAGPACAPPPPNDLCTNAPVTVIGAGEVVDVTGNSAGALDNDGPTLAGFPSAWEAIQLTSCVRSLELSWCSTAPGYTLQLNIIASDCPDPSIFDFAEVNVNDCPNGNRRMVFNNVPAGLYYVPIYEFGPYTMTVTTSSELAATATTVDDCIGGTFDVIVNIADDGGLPTTISWVATPGGPGSVAGVLGVNPPLTFPVGTTVDNLTVDNGGFCGALNLGSYYDGCPVQLVCGDPAVPVTRCYRNNEVSSLTYSTDINETITLLFSSGAIGPNDVITFYDGTDDTGAILPSGNGFSGVSLNGLVVTTTTNSLYITIESDGSGSCQDGQVPGATFNFSVQCTPDCEPADATVTENSVCATYSFTLDVEINSLGAGLPFVPPLTPETEVFVSYSVNGGAYTTPTGPYAVFGTVTLPAVGSFPIGTVVNVKLVHGSDALCDRIYGPYDGDQSCPVPGESCASPLVIPSVPTIVTGSTAARVDDHNQVCPFTAAGGRDVVYSYTPPVNQTISLTMCSFVEGSTTNFDSKLYVFAGSCGGASVACNDDLCNNAPIYTSNFVSSIASLAVTAGTTYYIVVDGYSAGDFGNYSLKIGVAAPPPANDNCANAIAVNTYPYTSPVISTVLATDDQQGVAGYNCGTGPTNNVWWVVTGVCGTMTASTCGSSFDTEVAIYTGSCGALTFVGCNDDNGPACAGAQGSRSWTATQGTTYYIAAGGWQAGNTGNIQLTVTASDTDGDGIGNTCDNCAAVSNTNQANADGDATGDACDACPLDALNDQDGDLLCANVDNCPTISNAGQENNDGDSEGDVCDADDDNDGVLDGGDNCPLTANAGQENYDGDAVGDVCDSDMDGDGIPNGSDSCPLFPGQNGGTCDSDPGPGYTLGTITACACVSAPCTQSLTIDWQTDANPGQITWEIRNQVGGGIVQSGGPLGTPNATFPTSTCVPNGCYYLRVIDSGGDGMTAGSNGGYILKTAPGGVRLLDNFRNFGNLAGGPPDVSSIPTNQGFCIPLGTTTGAIYTSCDKLDWTAGEYLVCSSVPAIAALYGGPNAATSGYEFWFFNPNGGYSFRKFRAHNVSDGFAPANGERACHIKLNNWAAGSYIPTGVLMNVRVRTRNAGTNGNWGPACRMMIDPVRAQCPLTKLMDVPGNEFLSCGATRTWGTGNYVHAVPVTGANKYQFRFRIVGEPLFVVTRTTTAYFLQLNWTPALTPTQYYVDVRCSKNGGTTWCTDFVPPALTTQWGDLCNLTISAPPVNGGNQNSTTQNAGLSMYPNPNRGDQLYLSLDAVEDGVNTVSVDIYDLFGKRVSARTIAVNDGFINTVLDLDGNMASGMYMVNITAGEKTYTERLVIQK